jgi:hypothetical protein
MIGVVGTHADFCDVLLEQGAGVKVGDVHHSPRSSMMISERGLPGALAIRSANLGRSSSDAGSGGIGPRGRGRIKPFATNLWIRTSMLSPGSSDTSGPSGKTWMRTLCCSRRLSGCSGRSIPFSYTAVTISTVISLTFLTPHVLRFVPLYLCGSLRAPAGSQRRACGVGCGPRRAGDSLFSGGEAKGWTARG